MKIEVGYIKLMKIKSIMSLRGVLRNKSRQILLIIF